MDIVVHSNAYVQTLGNMRCQDAEFLHLRDFLYIDHHTPHYRVGAYNRLAASYSLLEAVA